jgi:hypothetical protein
VVSKKAKAQVGVRGAMAMARHPTLRRATARAGAPTAKVGWRVGKAVAKRKARGHTERLVAAGRMAGSIVVIYGPMAAEVLRLADAPKPKRRAPAFAAGVVTGAGAAYFLIRQRRD